MGYYVDWGITKVDLILSELSCKKMYLYDMFVFNSYAQNINTYLDSTSAPNEHLEMESKEPDLKNKISFTHFITLYTIPGEKTSKQNMHLIVFIFMLLQP